MAGQTLDGNGTTIKFTTASTAGSNIAGVTEIKIGGVEIDKIEDSDLSNTAWKTYIAGKLKEAQDLTFTVKVKGLGDVPADGVKTMCTVTLPDSAGTYVAWGFCKRGELSAQNNTDMTCAITFTICNLNDTGVETGPVLTLA